MSNTNRCQECQYIALIENNFKECRINPPVIDPEYPFDFGHWPKVFQDGWYARFEQKKIISNSEKQ